MSFFNLNKKEKDKIIQDLKESYSLWREETKQINKPFFLIHNDFEQMFLKNISGGALKLFIYLGFRAKYQTGESWESIEMISSFFGKDIRTVAKWFKELEDTGLVTRKQKGFKMAATTFLKPYGFFPNEYKNKTLESNSVEEINKDLVIQKEKGLSPRFLLMLNYGFKEYTLVVIYQDHKEPIYICSYFIDFDGSEGSFNQLKLFIKRENLSMDSYDIDSSLLNTTNQKMSVYKCLLEYLKENNLS